MKYHISEKVDKKLRKYKRSNTEVFNLARKQLSLFEENEKHPSLRNHKLEGKLRAYWSISVGMGIRMIYLVKDGEAYFVDVGTHNEVYRTN